MAVGRQKAEQEVKEEVNKEIIEELKGERLLTELDELREEINCPKCKRTQRKYCKRCQRTRKGLDHLKGRIAKKYTDKEAKWKKNVDNK